MLGLGRATDLVGRLSDRVQGISPVIVSPPPPDWNPVLDPGSGTFTNPFHSITTGIKESNGRRPVYLRGGHYVEAVTVTGVQGPEDRKVTISSYRGEPVSVDCYVPDFLHEAEAARWQAGDVPGEFVWSQALPDGEDEEVSRGAFLDTHQHTRLITYDHLEDLQATNQLDVRTEDDPPFEVDPDASPPGDNHLWVENPAGEGLIPTERPRQFRDWMYLGPGLWFDTDSRLLHVRLSHTDHDTPGWPDYTGVTDPRRVRLALSKALTPALRLTDCKHLRFQRITFRFGGRETLLLRNCENVEFDRVDFRGGSRTLRFEADPDEHNKRIVFHDCEIDGGMPTWYFRSDRKDEYNFVPASLANATQNDVRLNRLGKATTNSLLSSHRNASGIEVHHCELVNGHDICLFGLGMRFHHNWVHNINDDALFMGSEDSDTEDLWIYRNVVTQVLTTLSFSSDKPVGQVRIFRNLFDLRDPTLGIRPRKDGDNPLRQGQLYKSNGLEGPFDLWHNTCLVLNAGGAKYVDERPTELGNAGFGHYKEYRLGEKIAEVRRSFNNIFVAAYPDSGITKAIAYLPLRSFDGPSDGNLYERIGPEDVTADAKDEPRFRVTDGDPAEFADIQGYRAEHDPWERDGIRADPRFRSFDSVTGLPHPDDDDLRPRSRTATQPASPAKGSAIDMPPDMENVDHDANGLAEYFGGDRGCYFSLRFPALPPFDQMSVGVGGRKKFPLTP